jgi:peptidoglycan/LPS O-acetylase OafA/YrhL
VPSRLPLIDALKALASQLIVLHHLAFYGPMSDTVRPYAAPLVDGLAEYGRLAVQVFLVVGGFLAARALSAEGVARVGSAATLVARRWARLAGPYLAAIALALITAAIGRALTDHPSVPEAPTARQLLANLAMLQDLAGETALSAGLWYVAIDLQLFAIATAIGWACCRAGAPGAMPAAVAALGAASLLAFNRDPGWDVWGIYYFGAYALGALAAWAGPRGAGRLAPLAIAVLGGVALLVEFRARIAVALATALLLAWGIPRAAGERGPSPPAIAYLARISYSVFLVHYPVCVLFEAAAARWFADDPLACALGLGLAWAASIAAGALLYRRVEAPVSAALSRSRAVPARP